MTIIMTDKEVIGLVIVMITLGITRYFILKSD